MCFVRYPLQSVIRLTDPTEITHITDPYKREKNRKGETKMFSLKLEEVLSLASEIYHTDIVILNQGETIEYYCDQRTERGEDNINVVTPFCFLNGYYYYICPDCQLIHRTDVPFGKIQTGCCGDIDCFRHLHINDKDLLIKRDPIFIKDDVI